MSLDSTEAASTATVGFSLLRALFIATLIDTAYSINYLSEKAHVILDIPFAFAATR
jgi:hypothetical protein